MSSLASRRVTLTRALQGSGLKFREYESGRVRIPAADLTVSPTGKGYRLSFFDRLGRERSHNVARAIDIIRIAEMRTIAHTAKIFKKL